LPGLSEHIDYAAYQLGLLGQRANMGAIYGDPIDFADVQNWWLGAALALGAQISVSVDMGALQQDTLSAYRSYLTQYRPFEGRLRIDNALQQQVFSNQVGDVWYVGVLNRETSARRIPVEAEALGLPSGAAFVAYDVERGDLIDADGSFTVSLDSESFRLFVVRQEAGMLWSNSRTQESVRDEGMEIQVSAPPTVAGNLQVYVPDLQEVTLDGVLLEEEVDPFQQPLGYTYDELTSLLTLWYPPAGRHLIHLSY
jgi:hypothetical protein